MLAFEALRKNSYDLSTNIHRHYMLKQLNLRFIVFYFLLYFFLLMPVNIKKGITFFVGGGGTVSGE